MKTQPTITDFRAADQWGPASTDTQNCKLNGSTYVVSTQDPNKYTVCLAKLKYTNFALQVTMAIQGDAGGVIFRDDGNGTYYRFAFNQSDPTTPQADTYSVFLCNKDCNNNQVGAGRQLG